MRDQNTTAWILAAATAIFASTAGMAQTAPNEAATNKSAGLLEEITVTARKTEEKIQDVPLAIKSFDPNELAKSGQGGLVDIAELTPGFVFASYSVPFDQSPTIRGLAQFDITSNVANVSTVVDGVYIPRNYAINLAIADVKQIEIVKGPQSALYGSNAFAGIIAYTLAPAPHKNELEALVTAGNGGRIDTKIGAGTSVFDDILGVRVNYASSKFDGTWKNTFPLNAAGKNYDLGGHDDETYGATVRFSPLKSLEVDLEYFHVDQQENLHPGYNVTNSDPQNHYNCGNFICGTLSTNPLDYASATSLRPAGILQPFQPGFHSATQFYSGRIRWDITDELRFNYTYGWVKAYATEITTPSDNAVAPTPGFNYSALFGPQCLGNTANPFALFAAPCFGEYNSAQKEGALSQIGSHEAQIEWNHGPVKAMIGFYRALNTDHYEFALGSVLAPNPIVGDSVRPFDFTGFPFTLLAHILSDKTTAEFARVSYDFLDARANVAAEVRHSSDDLINIDPVAGASQVTTFNATTPRFTGSYKLTPDNLVYLSVAEGEKQGGFAGLKDSGFTILPSQQVYQPETNWTYELGSKNTFLDGRAVVNADVFLVKWTNLQIEEAPAGVPVGQTAAAIPVNAGGATSKGVELEGRFALTSHLDLDAAFAAIDATFNSGDVSGRFAPICNGIVCPTSGAIGGHTLQRQSPLQGAGGATWKDSLTQDLSYFAHGEFTYQSSQYTDEMNLTKIPSRFLVNVSLGLKAEHWDLTLWSRNLFNRAYVADAFFTAFGGTPASASVGYSPSMGDLRTEGLTATFHY